MNACEWTKIPSLPSSLTRRRPGRPASPAALRGPRARRRRRARAPSPCAARAASPRAVDPDVGREVGGGEEALGEDAVGGGRDESGVGGLLNAWPANSGWEKVLTNENDAGRRAGSSYFPRMTIIRVDATAPDPAVIAEAAAIIRRGGLDRDFPRKRSTALAPTRSIPAAVRRIFAAKGRPKSSTH